MKLVWTGIVDADDLQNLEEFVDVGPKNILMLPCQVVIRKQYNIERDKVLARIKIYHKPDEGAIPPKKPQEGE